MIEAILYLCLGIFIGGCLSALYFTKRKSQLDEVMQAQFKLSAQEAVQNAHTAFLQRAEETFKKHQADGTYEFDKRQKAIDALVKPVQENLQDLHKTLEQVKGTDQALRQDLQNLHKETSKLAGALRNPAARGNWGEDMLERLLESSGLIKGVHYNLQPTMQAQGQSLRPDAIIQMPESMHIVIDAKAPINDFIRQLDEDLSEADYKNLQTNLAMAVKSHITQLSKKAYWEHLNSPDFVILFLPSEHLFSAAIQADSSLLEMAADKKIVLASPILTMSLLRVVGMSWKQVELAKNAKEISEKGADLYKRFISFTAHLEKIGKNLSTAMTGYDSAVGSLQNSLLPAARKFKDLQAITTTKHEEIDFHPITRAPREIILNSEDEKEKKSA